MKMNTALSVKVLQSTGALPYPAVPVCRTDCPSLYQPITLAARSQSTPAQEQETAVLSGPFPGCWLLSFLVQHSFWTTVFHATGPSPHRSLTSHNPLFMPCVPQHTQPSCTCPCHRRPLRSRGAPPLRSIVCHLSLLTRPGRTAHWCA